jgi:hypothetical protein
VTGHNFTSGGYGTEQNQDILYRHGATALASSEPDRHSVLGLQLANSAPGIGINMVPAVLSPLQVPSTQMVTLLSPYQIPMSAAQGLQFLAVSGAEKESSPVLGHITASSGQISSISNHGTTGLQFEKRDEDQRSSIFEGSSGTNTEHISQLEHGTGHSGARQVSSIFPGYGKENLGQIPSFRLGFNNIFPKYGYSLISGISDLNGGSSLGSGTSSLGQRPNIALGSGKINVGNVLPNTDINLASGYTEEGVTLDYDNSNTKYRKSNLLGSDNSGVKHSYITDNSNIFTEQPQKLRILAEHFDSAQNSNIKEGLNIEKGSLFGTEKTNSNTGYNSGTVFNKPVLEQSTVLGSFSTGNVASFGSSLGHNSNVFGQDQSLHFDTGSDAYDLGHTGSAGSGSGKTETGHQSEVSSGKHQNLESASSSFSASSHDLGNLGQRKMSGSVRDLSNGAGLYFTALEKDSNLNSAFSLPASYHGSGRLNQEHSLDSSARAGSHFTTRGKYTNSGSSSIPSVLRHGPKFRAGSGGSNLGHPSSWPTYSGTGSARPGHTVSGSILGQGSSLQGQTSVLGSRHYRPKHVQNNGASYLGHTSQREGLGLRYRPISNTEAAKGSSGFKQTSQPGIGSGINSLSTTETINSGSRDSSPVQYDQGFGTGSFILGKGLGSSGLGLPISGNQGGLGSQIGKAGSTATSTSNFNLGDYAVGDLGLTRQSFHRENQEGSVQ